MHVPPGDLAAARHARAATEAAGLRVASYGSYWRCSGPFEPVLASARELGAPRVRIWAGASPAASVRDVAAAAREAARSIAVAFEFHGGTLTEDIDSALPLIAASGVPCYWQPPQDMDDDEALDGLRRLPRVPAVHVFSWWPGAHACRCARGDAVGAVFAAFRDGDALLEFVPGDDPALVVTEAEELRRVAR